MACGGGGSSSSSGSSGGGTGGGSGASNPVILSKSTINMTGVQFNSGSADTLSISWSDARVASIVVGFPPDVQPVDWVLAFTTGNASPITLNISGLENRLDVGSYSTTLRVVAGDASDNVLGFRDVRVNYTVSERPMIGIEGTDNLTFYAIANSDETNSQFVTVTGDEVNWSSSSDVDWIFHGGSGLGRTDVDIRVQPGALEAGEYAGKVFFTDSKATDRVVGVDVTAIIQPKLEFADPGLAEDNIEHVVIKGAAPEEPEFVGLVGDGIDVEVTSNQPWLEILTAPGLAANGFEYRINASNLEVGTYFGRIIISDDDVNVPQLLDFGVFMYVEPLRIEPEKRGVAMVQTANVMQLEDSLLVRSNGDISSNWTAESSADWLTVTMEGEFDETLSVSADTTGLLPETLYEAQITLNAPQEDILQPETVFVALWVTDGSTEVDISTVSSAVEIIADPIRPYAYTHSDGGNIDVVNIYTGVVEKTYQNVVANAGNLAISDTGQRLYVHDLFGVTTVPVDLSDGAILEPLSTGGLTQLSFGRIDGKAILLTDRNLILDPETNRFLVNQFDPTGVGVVSGSANVVTSRENNVVCAMNEGISPATIGCFNARYFYSEEALEIRSRAIITDVNIASNGQDIAISKDGSKLYVASGGVYEFVTLDTSDLSDLNRVAVDPFARNIETAPDGRVIGNTDFPSMDDEDSYVLNEDGDEVDSFNLGDGDILARQLVISGDSLRVIGLTETGTLETRTLD